MRRSHETSGIFSSYFLAIAIVDQLSCNFLASLTVHSLYALGFQSSEYNAMTAIAETADLDLRLAIEASIIDFQTQNPNPEVYKLRVSQTNTSPGQQMADIRKPAHPGESLLKSELEHTDPPPRYTIDDCIRDFSTRQALEMPRVHDIDGDTYVFIDPPSKQPEQSAQSYEQYKHRYSKPFLMKREKLCRASGVFKEKLASPDYHFRTLRRHGLVGKLPEHVKYVLDLTPPTEDEDAVYLTASLCCSEGIRYWYQAGDLWNISDRLVGGRDEYTTLQWPHSSFEEASPLEYSPIRHRSAIERVLAAIQGQDITFDSAVKLWTTAVITEYYGITYMSCPYLTDSITTWLRVEPNNYFLEINTGASFRIATGLQNRDLARDTFAILVGEEALDTLYRDRNSKITKVLSTFGRKKDDLPEEVLGRVEYASKAFIDRNLKDFETLIYDEMDWLDNLPCVDRLKTFTEPDMQDFICMFKKTLKRYFRCQLMLIVCDNSRLPTKPSVRQDKGRALIPCKNEMAIYQELMPSERILTRMFWIRLRDDTNFTRTHEFTSGWKNLKKEGMANDPLIRKILATDHRECTTNHLRELVAKGQSVLEQTKAVEVRANNSILRIQRDEDMVTRTDTRTIASATGNFSTMTLAQDDDAEHPPLLTLSVSDPSEPSSKPLNHAPSSHEVDIVPVDHPCGSTVSNTGSSISLVDPTRNNPEDSLDWSDQTDQEAKPKKCPVDSSSINPLGDQSKDELFSIARERFEERRVIKAKDNIWSTEVWDGKKHIPHVVDWSTNQIYNSDIDHSTSSLDTPSPDGPLYFNIIEFFREVDIYLEKVAYKKLLPSDSNRQDPYRPTIISTLTSLHETEWKFLPLWAGGSDDDTGGVYNEDIMETMPGAGFSTAGPSIHTGDSTYSSSDFDMLSNAETGSTFNTSTAVADGYTDQLHRHVVYSCSASSASSADESVVDVGEEAEEAEARRQIAAYECAQADAAKMAAQRHREQEKLDDIGRFDDDIFDDDEYMEDDLDSDSDVTETGDDFVDVGHDTHSDSEDM